jgi:RNA polymerase sigma factor (sigma-70 family)
VSLSDSASKGVCNPFGWSRRGRTYTRALEISARNRFATTHWSMVLLAADRGSPDADQALARLCERYWYPLYGYLRGRGYSADNAQDLTQAFFSRLIEGKVLRHADPARGRFRSFLLVSMKNFAANERERARARKRGDGVPNLSLEFEGAEGRLLREPPTFETPERVFDRRWAIVLLDGVAMRLRDDLTRAGKERQFEYLQGYLTGEVPAGSYAQAGEALGMSEGAVKVVVHRLRRRFRDLLRDEIAQTVSSPEEIEEEIRHLWTAVAR